MMVWTLLEWLAWALCAGIALWLITDMIRVSSEYDEEFLTTGIEGLDESSPVENAGGLG